VREENTNLRYHTQRSFIPSHVVIVAKKTAKSGRNNSDKRNRKRTNSTNNNKRNFLKEPREKWKETYHTKPNGTTLIIPIIPLAQLMMGGITEEGIVIVPGITIVVVVVVVPPNNVLHKNRAIILVTSRV